MKFTTKSLIACLMAFLGMRDVSWSQPTWSNGVGEIFYNHCSRCHHDGGIGPFPIMGYSDVSVGAAELIYEIVEGNMPPWPADQSYRHFAFENTIDDQELATLQEWLASGAPEGDIGQAPTPPVFNNVSQLPEVDFSGETGAYASTAATSDAYRTFVIPSEFTSDQYIDGIEILPGNAAIVHHVLIYYDPTDDCLDFDAADAGLGFETNGTGGGLPPSVKYMGAWVPGNSEMILPEGFAFLAEAGGHFLVEIHYPEDTEGMVDNTIVNFKFTEDPTPREVYMDPIINHFPPILDAPFLFIPANDTTTFYASYTVPADVTLIATMPHMHLIGREMYCWGETPLNQNIPLVGIDEWDFHWQFSYMYPSLVHLPDNTEIRAYAWYDNTAANPHQPNDPPQNVLGGEETDDEMLVVFFVYTVYQNGDENIVVDPNVGLEEVRPNELSVSIGPNPTSDLANLYLFSKSHGEMTYEIIDAEGRSVQQNSKQVRAGTTVHELPIEKLNSGIYLVKTKLNGQYQVNRLIIQ
jgi:Secretion system C-terminal sorting domain